MRHKPASGRIIVRHVESPVGFAYSEPSPVEVVHGNGDAIPTGAMVFIRRNSGEVIGDCAVIDADDVISIVENQQDHPWSKLTK